MQKYDCALCDDPLYVGSDMITVSVDGHAKAAHRVCPGEKWEDEGGWVPKDDTPKRKRNR